MFAGHDVAGKNTAVNPLVVQNIDDICATCLHQHKNARTSVNMCDRLLIQDTIEVYELLESISLFKWSERTPQWLCSKCSLKLLNIYEFQQMCNKSYLSYNNYIKQENAHDAITESEKIIQDNNFMEESVITKEKQNLIGVISEEKNEISRIEDADAEDVTCTLDIEDAKIQGLRSDSEESVESRQKCSTETQESVELTTSQSSHDKHSKKSLGLDKKKICNTKRKDKKDVHVCKHCNRVFKKRQSLREHESSHTGVKPFKCKQCAKAFASNRALNLHKVSHSSERPFACKICTKTFKSWPILMAHMVIHAKEHFGLDKKENCVDKTDSASSEHVCKYCNKVLSRKQTLIAHERTHTRDIDHIDAREGVRNFMCTFCGSRLGSKYTLSIHERSHTGEKPFKCNQCEKAFTTRKRLNYHKQTHSAERPFGCKLCGKAFKDKWILNSHMAIHAKEHFGLDKKENCNNKRRDSREESETDERPCESGTK